LASPRCIVFINFQCDEPSPRRVRSKPLKSVGVAKVLALMPRGIRAAAIRMLLMLVLWKANSVAAPLKIQGLIRDHTSRVGIPGVVISADASLAAAPATSRSDGQFDLTLTDKATAGTIVTVYTRKPNYSPVITVCPIVEKFLCTIEISAVPSPIAKADIKTPPQLEKASPPVHSAVSSLQIQMAGISFEELKFSLVSSGKGRFLVDRLFLKLRGYADCTLGGFTQFAPTLGTPAYWMHLSDDSSEYDLFPQDASGDLSTWQYSGDDVGQFWVKLTGRSNRLHVLSVEVDARSLDNNGKAIHISSPTFKYFYTSDGVSGACSDLDKWYRPEFLRTPRQEPYAGAPDLLSYQLLTADFKYAASLLSRTPDADLKQKLPDLKRVSDYWLDNQAFAENVRTIARHLESKGQLSYIASLIYQYGTIPPADFLKSLSPSEQAWLDSYTKSFVYKRWQAIHSYRTAARPRAPAAEESGWHEAAIRHDEAIATAEQAILDDSRDASLAKMAIAVLAYDGACSWSRAGDLDRSAVLLRRAIETGYRDAKWIQDDPDLEALRKGAPALFKTLVNIAQKDPTQPDAGRR
jgi:hypothetical protein